MYCRLSTNCWVDKGAARPACSSIVKIAIIRQRYDAHGGAERFVSRAVDALRAQGTQATIIARQWTGEAGTGNWLRCDPFYMGRIWRDKSFARAACKAVATGHFDLVQSHERIPCCDIYRAGDGVHAQWLENRASSLGTLRRLALRLSPFHRHLINAERRLFASPGLRAIICNSRMVRDELARWFPAVSDRLHVIHNGVDLERFDPARALAHRDAMRQRMGILPDARTLLFVGSGFERKGVRVLIDAFARIRSKTDFLVVVGRDRHASRYRAHAESLGLSGRIHWAGAQEDVLPWYGLADAFALPTLYDPFPNAALEALACGLPVITTLQCGAAEIIREGWNGCVCQDPLDPAELANKITDALDNAQSMRINARSSVKALGLQDMTRALLDLYASLGARASSPR